MHGATCRIFMCAATCALTSVNSSRGGLVQFCSRNALQDLVHVISRHDPPGRLAIDEQPPQPRNAEPPKSSHCQIPAALDRFICLYSYRDTYVDRSPVFNRSKAGLLGDISRYTLVVKADMLNSTAV